MGDTFSLEPGVGDVVAPVAVYRVPSDYASLQAAVDAVLESANTRAIIELEGPTFTGADIDLTGLTFESITLMGRSQEPNDTQLTGTLNVTLSGGAWLSLQGLCFVGTVDALVVDGTGAVRLDRCRFSSSAGNALDISGSVGIRTAGFCEFRRPIVWSSDSSCELLGADIGPINMSSGVWGPQIVASNGYMNVLSGELRGTITLSGDCVLTAGPQIWRVGAEHPITSSGTAQWQVSADSLQVFASTSKTWDTSGSVGAVALAGLVRGAVYGSPYPSTLYYPAIGGTYAIEAGVMPSVNGAAVIGGGVTAFNSRTGSVTPQNGDYTASQVGADATGTAAAAVAAHEATSDPHPAYLKQAEADALYEALGAAAAAIAAHEAAGNPHPGYLTEAEATALFEELGEASAAVTAHEAAENPHPGYLTPAEGDAAYEELGAAAAAIAAHEAAGNPHPGYLTPAEGDAAYEELGAAAAAIAAHEAAGNPHPGYLTPAEGDAAYEALGAVAAAITTHEAASNPHPGYLTQAEADALYEPVGGGSGGGVAASYDAVYITMQQNGNRVGFSTLESGNIASYGLTYDGYTFTASAAGWVTIKAICLANGAGTTQISVGATPLTAVNPSSDTTADMATVGSGAWFTFRLHHKLASGDKINLLHDGTLGTSYSSQRLRVTWMPI